MMAAHSVTVSTIVAGSEVVRWDALCTCGWRPKRSAGSRKLINHYVTQHLDKHVNNACPSQGKRGFASQAEAQQSLRTIWTRGRDGRLPARAYMCRCGKWHLTSQAKASVDV